MIKTVRLAIATALLLAAGNVAALGLGQIEVKSRLNQPLLAEIPIISTVPGELEALQARLASPETFRRIGLAPPTGLAADLQFSLGSDVRGRPVIRVTTTAPVNQAVLNFLIEVDWGQGRLVREYSALVDAPRTASAPVQPAISAPVVGAPNVVQRPAPVVAAPVVAAPRVPPPPPVVATAPPPATMPQPAPAPEPATASTSVQPLPPSAAPAAVAARPVPARPAAPAPLPAQYGPVKRGETLSRIASELPVRAGYTLDQTMLALLRANPDAFLGQDMNQLRQGAVLRVPGSGEVAGVDAAEAALVVREQMREWRQARRAVVQPDQVATVARAPAAAAATEPTPARRPAAPAQPAPARRQPAQARLAIVPPTAPGTATGTRSGTSAGGEGTMLQQQLRQRDEDLAARQAEIGELKDRVAQLENLQKQQQQLLALKDSELAAAQQRLAQTRKAEAAVAGALPATATTQPVGQAEATAQSAQPDATTSPSSAMPWIWGSLALLGLALLAWVLRRRSAPVTVAPRRGFDSEALAASMAPPTQDDVTSSAAQGAAIPSSLPEASTSAALESDSVVHRNQGPPTPSPRGETPAWHSANWVKAAPPPAAPVLAASTPSFVQAHQPADPASQASAAQRLKLALAFLDIGDDASARQLLRELQDDADPTARTEAARMLRELG
ncbi:MAG: FimV/HubP family polar landmark protein [Pseudomonadota bacterium]